jgi:uncharacterized membrane protein
MFRMRDKAKQSNNQTRMAGFATSWVAQLAAFAAASAFLFNLRVSGGHAAFAAVLNAVIVGLLAQVLTVEKNGQVEAFRLPPKSKSKQKSEPNSNQELGTKPEGSSAQIWVLYIAIAAALSAFLFNLRISTGHATLSAVLNGVVVGVLARVLTMGTAEWRVAVQKSNTLPDVSSDTDTNTDVAFVEDPHHLYKWGQAAVALVLFGVFLMFVPVADMLRNTVPTGGDVSAHVWFPDALARSVFPHLSGWSDDWYAGFPVGALYFPLPALITSLLNVVLPYGPAMKITLALAAVLPGVAAYMLGSRTSDRPLYAIAFAAGTVGFQLERFHTIYGGNLSSLYAGMFSLSLGFAFGLFALAAVTPFLRGKVAHPSVWFPIALVAAALSHLLSGVFVAVITLIALLAQPGRLSKIKKLWLPGLSAVCIAAVWWVPFLRSSSYATDMGYSPTRDFSWLWPPSLVDPSGPVDQYYVVLPLAVISFALALWKNNRAIATFGASAIAFAAMYYTWPTTYVWDARWLPFYYWSLWILASVCLFQIADLFSRKALASMAGVAVLIWPLLAGSHLVPAVFPVGEYVQPTVASWARWDMSGYEKKADWPEYQAVMQMLVKESDSTGCGRAHWEYDADQGSYGSPMSMMLIPFWTGGCVDSMEGLFMEGSQTTPFHFMMQYATSQAGSGPVRDMPNPQYGLDWGVKSMRALGVKWFLAYNPETIKDARAMSSDLRELATSPKTINVNTLVAGAVDPDPRWVLFEVVGAESIEGLSSYPKYLDDTTWPTPYAQAFKDDPTGMFSNAPASWGKGEVQDPAQVTNIEHDDNGFSFDVSEIGKPVAVRYSWYPTWKVKGASQPYRLGPNMMVIVPTEKHVEFKNPAPVGRGNGELLALAGLGLFLCWLRLRAPGKTDTKLFKKATSLK